MFHVLDYNLTDGINDVLVDMLAVVDETFTRRGGAGGTAHYIFTEKFNLLCHMHLAVKPTQVQFNVPTWNAYGNAQLPYMADTTTLIMPNPSWINDFRDMPMVFPKNEEIAIQESNLDAAGGTQANSLLWIAPDGWTRNVAQGNPRITLRATASIVGAVGAWSTFSAITMQTQMREGVYAVNGITAFDGAATPTQIALRMNFPSGKFAYGQFKMFPGCLIQSPFTAVPLQKGINFMGEWGRFSSFNLPTVQALAVAAGTRTITLDLDLSYLGSSDQQGLLSQAA